MTPAFLDRFLDPSTRQPRHKAFWIVLGALAVGQLFAFWLLCSHQVRKAEARQTELQVQQMALADCLRTIPGSTIGSCTRRPAAERQPDPAPVVEVPVATATAHPATPVSYTFR